MNEGTDDQMKETTNLLYFSLDSRYSYRVEAVIARSLFFFLTTTKVILNWFSGMDLPPGSRPKLKGT